MPFHLSIPIRAEPTKHNGTALRHLLFLFLLRRRYMPFGIRKIKGQKLSLLLRPHKRVTNSELVAKGEASKSESLRQNPKRLISNDSN